jgi:hypothetical protein
MTMPLPPDHFPRGISSSISSLTAQGRRQEDAAEEATDAEEDDPLVALKDDEDLDAIRHGTQRWSGHGEWLPA